MLQEIYIKNFVLIDEMRLELGPGLNILSGETGAGKSIIIDALGLVLGERVKNDYLRDENQKAVVEAVFDISRTNEARSFLTSINLDEEENNDLVLSRDIAPGRTAMRITGRNVTVNSIKSLSTCLVDMHLQNERYDILRPSRYIDYVDSFAVEAGELADRLAHTYNTLRQNQKQLEEFRLSRQERMQRLDFLSFQIQEIERAGLYQNEDQELLELRERIRNSRKLLEGSEKLIRLLYNSAESVSAFDMIAAALDTALELKSDSFFAGMISPLENMYYVIQDLSGQLSSFANRLDFEPDLLEQTEDRLHEINRLKNKYGKSIEEILAYLDKARQEREMTAHSEEQQQELEKEIARLENEYLQLARVLSEQRRAAALVLEEKVYAELRDLNMPEVRFSVSIKERPVYTEKGMDEIDFLFSPNPGEDMKPISRIASGGEISRFILALKKALADIYEIPTLIFDEIDVGLGGTALNAMARKLAELSLSHQVILVTHSPQVASCADRHFIIRKYVEGEKTFTRVDQLAEEEKIKEIARMLGGECYSDVTLQHARK
jgi:DNA repair protein RecN (Recombination protein N)